MKNLDIFLAHLREFEKNRQRHKDDLERIKDLDQASGRKEYAEIIADCFIPCAQAILSGHFRVVNNIDGNELARLIYPTAIELYYHEEGDGRFKDPIMYHTDDRKNAEHRKNIKQPEYFKERRIQGLPYFPIGNMNPHTSGIDITFENPVERYRASFLIRKYMIQYESGTRRTVVNSTDLYDDLLINGISINGTDCLEWIDVNNACEVSRGWRQNVPSYNVTDPLPENWFKIEAEGVGTFQSGKARFAKCPFDWQFYRK